MSSNSSFSLPIPEEKMFKLFSDLFSPTPADLVQNTSQWTRMNQLVLEFSWELHGKNKPDVWDIVANVFLGKTRQQVEEDFASRHSVNMPPEPEPEKEKALERNGTWSEEEKRLFLSGLEKYGPGKWKKISEHIGTRSPEQVRNYDRRRRLKLNTGDQQTHCQPWPPAISKDGLCSDHGTSVWGSNVPPPIRRDLALLRPEHGLQNIYGNFWGLVCHPSWNLRAEMGANPSSRISDHVWNSTNTLSSDSCGCPPGLCAYGNNMNPGQ